MLKLTDPGYIDNISHIEGLGRQITVRCADGPKSVIHITPKDVTWDTWVHTASRYQETDEELISIDIGPTGIQLTFKKVQ